MKPTPNTSNEENKNTRQWQCETRQLVAMWLAETWLGFQQTVSMEPTATLRG